MKITAVHLNLFNSIELKVGRFSSSDPDQGPNKSSKSGQVQTEKEKLVELANRNGVWLDVNKIYDQQAENLSKQVASNIVPTDTFVYDSSGISRNELGEKGLQLNVYL